MGQQSVFRHLMPSPTLLECFDKYIPDHIFKNIKFDDEDDNNNNHCITFGGCGVWHCYNYIIDEPASANWAGDEIQISFKQMLRAKVWFDWVMSGLNRWYFDGDLDETAKQRMTEYIYNTYTNKCTACSTIFALYQQPFITCRTCDGRLCVECFMGDNNATVTFDGTATYIHSKYGDKTFTNGEKFEDFCYDCSATTT